MPECGINEPVRVCDRCSSQLDKAIALGDDVPLSARDVLLRSPTSWHRHFELSGSIDVEPPLAGERALAAEEGLLLHDAENGVPVMVVATTYRLLLVPTAGCPHPSRPDILPSMGASEEALESSIQQRLGAHLPSAEAQP